MGMSNHMLSSLETRTSKDVSNHVQSSSEIGTLTGVTDHVQSSLEIGTPMDVSNHVRSSPEFGTSMNVSDNVRFLLGTRTGVSDHALRIENSHANKCRSASEVVDSSSSIMRG